MSRIDASWPENPRNIMHEDTSNLIVCRVGGLFRQSMYKSLRVVMDGQQVGVIGEEIPVVPGTRTVKIKTAFFTCRPLTVEIKPASTTILNYHSSWLASVSVAFGVFLFMALASAAAIILDQMKVLIERDVLAPGVGLLVLLAFLVAYGWVAFGGPLRILAALGIHSHTLVVSDESD